MSVGSSAPALTPRPGLLLVFLLASNGGIFVSSTEYGVAFAEELLQSRGSAGVF